MTMISLHIFISLFCPFSQIIRLLLHFKVYFGDSCLNGQGFTFCLLKRRSFSFRCDSCLINCSEEITPINKLYIALTEDIWAMLLLFKAIIIMVVLRDAKGYKNHYCLDESNQTVNAFSRIV